MPEHEESLVLPFSAAQMFDLVIDIERYPEFLPWCSAARVIERREAGLDAELVIGFKMFRECYCSKVRFERPAFIDVTPTSGPFRRMSNRWRFEELPEGGCRIHFYVDFAFRSTLLNKVIGPLFYEAVRRMVSAFEARAVSLYGDPAGHPPDALPDSA